MRRLLLVAGILLALLFAAGCTGTYAPADDGKLVVGVSIVPEETFVRAVAGDLADIVVMIPPGYSPENYEPTAKQMQKCTEADVYFGIGIPAESSILPSLNPATRYVALEQKVSAVYPDLLIGGSRDPHIWLSPKRACVMVQAIADELSIIDSEHASLYQANASAYIAEIAACEKELSSLLLPAKGKTFIADHPAFGYFADDFGLVMTVLEEEGKEATIEHRMQLEDLARSLGITTVFYQEESGGSQIRQFAEAINGVCIALSPLSDDYLMNLRVMAELIGEEAR